MLEGDVDRCLRGFERSAGAQASHYLQPEGVARKQVIPPGQDQRLHRNGKPEIDIGAHENAAEAARSDADDAEDGAADTHGAAENVGPAAERVLPEAVRDDGYRPCSGRPVLFRGERAPQYR